MNTFSYVWIIWCILTVSYRLFKELNVRVLCKKQIIFRLKDNRKIKFLILSVYMLIPSIIYFYKVIFSGSIFFNIMCYICIIEFATYLIIIALNDVIFTNRIVGKDTYIQLSDIQSYSVINDGRYDSLKLTRDTKRSIIFKGLIINIDLLEDILKGKEKTA